MQYLFLDEGRMTTSPQWEERNLAAAVFRIEQNATPDGIQAVAEALDAWPDRDEQASLRRALETWLVQSVLPARLPGADLPDTLQLSEVRAMLGERLRTWGDERETKGESHALVAILRHQVAGGLLRMDQARALVESMVASCEITAEAGRAALDQLG